MKRNTRQEEREASEVKHRKPNLKGIPTMILGLLLVVAALVLACYNICDEQRAGLASNDLLNSLESAIVTEQQEETARGSTNQTREQPLYIRNPGMEMPVITIEQEDYLGTLTIPSLGLTLPVLDDWSSDVCSSDLSLPLCGICLSGRYGDCGPQLYDSFWFHQ